MAPESSGSTTASEAPEAPEAAGGGWQHRLARAADQLRVTRGVPDVSAAQLGVFRFFIGCCLALAVATALRPGLVWKPLATQVDEGILGGWALLHHLDASRTALTWVHGITVAALVAFLLGLRARLAVGIAALGVFVLVSALLLQRGTHDWGIPILALAAFATVPWSDGFSLDESLRRLRGRPSRSARRGTAYGFGIWVPGFLVGVAFAAAAYAKLRTSGLAWITGGAVRYHFLEDSLAAPFDWGIHVALNPWLPILLSAGAVTLEAGFFLVLFFRDERIRGAFGLAAVGLLSGFRIFQGVFWPAWWSLLSSFLPWQAIHAGLGTLAGERILLIDGRCGLCRRTRRRIHAADWLDRLAFADASDDRDRERAAPGLGRDEALADLFAVDVASGERRRGYAAYLWILRANPVLWPVAALAALPGVRHVGAAIYRGVAARRARDAEPGACALHGPSEAPPAEPARERAAFRPLRPVQLALVAVVIGQQLVMSWQRTEHEPLLSNFPMYSSTWPSLAAFWESRRWIKFQSYRIVAENDQGQWTDVTDRLETHERYLFVEAYRDLHDTGAPVPEELASRLDGLVQVLGAQEGSPVRRVAVYMDQEGLDVERRRLYPKAHDVYLTTLDVSDWALDREQPTNP